MKIQAGKMRSEMVIEQPTPGTLGQPTYGTFITVRGELQTMSGREIISGHLVGADVSHMFLTRYTPGVTSRMRLRISGSTRVFVIKYVITEDEDNARMLQIYCREVLA